MEDEILPSEHLLITIYATELLRRRETQHQRLRYNSEITQSHVTVTS